MRQSGDTTLNEAAVDEAAALLEGARREVRLLDELPESVRPRTVGDAYAIQARLVERLGLNVVGWFCACTNRTIQRMLGLDEPYYARLLDGFVMPSPATIDGAQFPPMILECEFGFRLSRDLPARAGPYARTEVEAAIDSVHPTIEVVAGHLRNWPEQDVYSVIADNGTDGVLVVGDGTDYREAPPLVEVSVELSVNGEPVRSGIGRNVLGDPIEALVWLANARARDGGGLTAGDIHNTGTATDIVWVERGDYARVVFDGLGEASLRID